MNLSEIKEWLYQKYWKEELSMRTIAKRCGMNYGEIRCLMWKLGIPTRTRIEARNTERCLKLSSKLMKGELNHQFGLKEERSANWKGGRKLDKNGYVYLKKPFHPKASKDGYVAEHIFIWMNYYQRSIPLSYMVHHEDKDRQNNQIENLTLVDHREHTNIHKKPVSKETREKMSRIQKLSWKKRRIESVQGIV